MKQQNITAKLFNFSLKTAAKASARRRRPFCSAILAAAGQSQRMGQNKLLMELAGKQVIQYSLEALQNSEAVDEIIVVCSEAIRTKVFALCQLKGYDKVKAVVLGGDTRAQSVAEGLRQVSPKAELVAVHDAARPLADSEFITSVISAAKGKPGVIPVVPVKDTVKIVEGGKVTATPERAKLFAAQTPQVFDADLYKAAAAAAADDASVTDDCMMLERFGAVVETVEGREDNIKLTTQIDAAMAALFLERRGKK